MRLIISFIILNSFFAKLNQENIKLKLAEVILKFKGTGKINILSESFFKKNNKCEIYINDTFLNISKYYFITLELNDLGSSEDKYYFSDSEIVTNNPKKEFDLESLTENASTIEQNFGVIYIYKHP